MPVHQVNSAEPPLMLRRIKQDPEFETMRDLAEFVPNNRLFNEQRLRRYATRAMLLCAFVIILAALVVAYKDSLIALIVGLLFGSAFATVGTCLVAAGRCDECERRDC